MATESGGRIIAAAPDNPAYRDWPNRAFTDIHCIGRVIWAGRKIS